jgi:hydroxymethylpyrimidine pyrophosphatase-like HAD family hydrolase
VAVPGPLSCVYVDLDSTLLGKGASLLHDGDGRFSLLGARALEACDRAGVEVMIYSGRRQSTLFHDARIMGISCYAFEADRLLAEHGFGHLRLVDNGGIHLPVPGVEHAKAYHLVPAGASKANGVAFHMRARGYERDGCIAVGDSREDMGAAAVVRTFWLVANALDRDPSIREALGANTRVCGERNGAGVYEAVITELSERRA